MTEKPDNGLPRKERAKLIGCLSACLFLVGLSTVKLILNALREYKSLISLDIAISVVILVIGVLLIDKLRGKDM